MKSVLAGKRGLVVGIANAHSIADGCATAFHTAGAELAVTYADERSRPYVAPVVAGLDAPIFMPLDVDGQLEAVFAAIDRKWGRLDFLLHSIAFCPKDNLQGPVSHCSKAGFAQAMDVSVHSLIRMTRMAVPLMKDGGDHHVAQLSWRGNGD
ncbi:MAG: SDR family oxidoreductase [Paracoccaceae bacterium]